MQPSALLAPIQRRHVRSASQHCAAMAVPDGDVVASASVTHSPKASVAAPWSTSTPSLGKTIGASGGGGGGGEGGATGGGEQPVDSTRSATLSWTLPPHAMLYSQTRWGAKVDELSDTKA